MSGTDEIHKMIKDASDRPLLQMKLKDVSVLYQAFRVSVGSLYDGRRSDGRSGKSSSFFQKNEKQRSYSGWIHRFYSMRVIRELLAVCEKVTVTVTMDVRENFVQEGKPHELFYMSHKMIRQPFGIYQRYGRTGSGKDACSKSRFAQAPALNFWNRICFVIAEEVIKRSRMSADFSGRDSGERDGRNGKANCRLVRDTQYRYGQIAVITGNLEEYGSIARHVFEAAGIPFFIDEKHSVLMNPFVEYVRAALEMAVQGFSYESVFRYLRCGMS